MISIAGFSSGDGLVGAETSSPGSVPHSDVNIGELERVASIASGAALLAGGILRGSWRGAVLALAGGGLIFRGLKGNCAVYRALGISTSNCPSEQSLARMQRSVGREARAALDTADPVEEASYESFPASDPPGWRR